MEMYTMLQTAAALFVIAAAGGLIMAGMRFTGSLRPPSWLAMVHGLLAAAGLTLLAYAAATAVIPQMAQISLAFFAVAAIGGVAMNLMFHLKLLPLPKPLLIIHALLAVTGLLLLLLSIYRQSHLQ